MVFISPNEDGEKLPEPEELDKQKKWTQTVEQMFIGYKNYKPDRGFIDSFLMEEFDFKLYNFLGHEVIINMIQYFQAGVTQPNRVFCEDYVRIMRKIYKMLTESNKHVYQKHFINEWQHHRIDYSPYFETLIPHYADKVKDLLAAVAAKPTEVEEYVREEMRFLILLTPVTSLMKICDAAIKDPNLLHFVLAVCTDVHELFRDRKLSIYHNDYETQKVEPLLVVVFRRLIFNARLVATPDSHWTNFENFVITFCIGDEPLISPWTLLDLVFCEIYTLNRIPTKSIEVLTGIASRITSPKNKAKFDWKFATSLRTKPDEHLFLTPTIIDMVLQLMVENHETKNYDIVENCKAILQGIGNRMREENAEFDEETKQYLMEKLRELPWYIEYAMSTWFWALNVIKRRVPSAILNSISRKAMEEDAEKEERQKVKSYTNVEEIEGSDVDDARSDVTGTTVKNNMYLKITDKFEAIPDEDSTEPIEERYIRSLMEIGFFDVECALELLYIESTIKFENKEELEELVKKLIKKLYWVEMGLLAHEDARILSSQILEIFEAPSGATTRVVEMLYNLQIRRSSDGTPSWTQDLTKSLIIQPLRVEPKPKKEWPPAESSFVKLGASRIRHQQKKYREALLEMALRKSKAFAQHHRDTWAQRDTVIKEWTCPASPPNEYASDNESFAARSRSLLSPPRNAQRSKSRQSGEQRSKSRQSRGSRSKSRHSQPRRSPSPHPQSSNHAFTSYRKSEELDQEPLEHLVAVGDENTEEVFHRDVALQTSDVEGSVKAIIN